MGWLPSSSKPMWEAPHFLTDNQAVGRWNSWPPHTHLAASLPVKADFMGQRNWELYSGTALSHTLRAPARFILLMLQLENNKI